MRLICPTMPNRRLLFLGLLIRRFSGSVTIRVLSRRLFEVSSGSMMFEVIFKSQFDTVNNALTTGFKLTGAFVGGLSGLQLLG